MTEPESKPDVKVEFNFREPGEHVLPSDDEPLASIEIQYRTEDDEPYRSISIKDNRITLEVEDDD